MQEQEQEQLVSTLSGRRALSSGLIAVLILCVGVTELWRAGWGAGGHLAMPLALG